MTTKKLNKAFFESAKQAGMIRLLSKSPKFRKQYALFKKRTKHPIGNVFMAAVCIPLGYFLAGFGGIAIGGVIAAIVASTMERYEFGPIDDNILITISSSIVLYMFIL